MLYVSRLEPENNARMVIEAFKKVRTAYRLLVVGDAPYAHEYIQDLKERARGDRRIIFTGFVFGQDYRALQQNAYCYVHATEVGGTHPALLEAMGAGGGARRRLGSRRDEADEELAAAPGVGGDRRGPRRGAPWRAPTRRWSPIP